ncbi:cupin domain-containing protein [uncultured Xylophilus sp.]|uniref:cupin domain-containing protein n=1 Tax=uncultured Xylophilus sp. TaxID=296832 RepID=UPI0025D2944D|nr:cupin domain-containing protein [uncultured Xylophilus sp.]
MAIFSTRSPARFTMADHLWFTTARLSILLSKTQNTGGISLIEHRMPRDFAVPLHVHVDEEESFCMLDGEVRIRVGEEIRLLTPGESLAVPAGLPHSFRVVSGEARFLTVTTGRFEDMVRSLARPAQGPGLPPQEAPTADQIDALVAACARHGIEFRGPAVD